LGLKQALAASCNQYFYQLAERTSSRAFLETLVQLGLKKPELSTQHSAQDVAEALVSPKMMIGLDPDLEFIPMQVFQGYLELVSSGSSRSSSGSGRGILEPAGALIVAALRLGAMQGTSVLAGRSLPARHHLLGKTGTCPAFAAGRYLTNQTDGWFVGFYPAQQPTLGVMVRYPNGLGARDAAPLGGQAIRAYLELIR
jgi:cell division protein FtsI/penicillin-binding protein 2